MAATATSIPVGKKLPKKPAKPLVLDTRAVPEKEEIDEVAATQRFKDLMRNYAGKLKFEGYDG